MSPRVWRLPTARIPPLKAVAFFIFCLSLGMSLWQLSVPEMLSTYDTGVYLAATIHLVSGVMPYKDFTFVQPPGILLIMSPVGVFSRIVGTHDGLILARIVSSIVTAPTPAFSLGSSVIAAASLWHSRAVDWRFSRSPSL